MNEIFSLNNSGMQSFGQNKLDEALYYLKKATTMSNKYPQPWRNLGLVYNKLGKPKEAIACFEKAISIDINYILAYVDLGITANYVGNQRKAIDTFLKWADVDFSSPWPYQNLASLYFQSSQYEKASQYFKKAIEKDPSFSKSWNGLFLAYRMICDWKKASKIEKVLNGNHDEDPYVSLIRSEDPQKNYQTAKKASENIILNTPKTEFSYSGLHRKKIRKIRIGYLSRDFIGQIYEEEKFSLFQFHNRDDFEVYIYSYHGSKDDDFSKILMNNSDKYIDISGLTDVDAAKQINQDQINILVDLMGHTLGSRLAISAMRPAPVQVTWLGFAGTSGADFFDYNIVDKISVPENEKRFFSEMLTYLPDSFQINYLNKNYSKKTFKKADFNLPEKSFIFSSFNQAYKFEPVMFGVWMEILKETNSSVLWLNDPGQKGQKNLTDFAADHGVNPKRIIFSKRLPKKSDHLKRLSLTDLALDTYIFGGHLTTSDYLKAGVPVLTRKGSHLISRVSSSILTTFGLKELITNNLEEYKILAIELAQNHEKFSQIKRKTKLLQKNSLLFNTKFFIKNLEENYKKMWNKYNHL